MDIGKLAGLFVTFFMVLCSCQTLFCFAKPTKDILNQRQNGHVRRRRSVADHELSDRLSREILETKRRKYLSFLLNVAERSTSKSCYCPSFDPEFDEEALYALLLTLEMKNEIGTSESVLRNTPCQCAVRKAYDMIMDTLNDEDRTFEKPGEKAVKMLIDQLPIEMKASIAEHIVRMRNEKRSKENRLKRRYLRHVNYARRPHLYHNRRLRGKMLLSH